MSMRKIYRKLAKKHGVNVKEIRQDMQAALTEAYTNPLNNNAITKAYQNRIPRGGSALSGGRIEKEQGMNCVVFCCEKMRGS